MIKTLPRNSLGFCSIFIVTSGLAFYAVPLQRRFAVLDDYRKVLEVVGGIRLIDVHRGMSGTLWDTGRVVPALFSGILWRNIHSVSHLPFMRFIALIAVLVALVALTRLLKVCNAPDIAVPHVLTVTVLGFVSLLFLPSVAATVTFATLAIPMIAVPIAISAGLLLSSRLLTRRQIVGSSLLILCSVFSYQQMAVMTVLPVFFATALHYSRGWSKRQSLERCALALALLGTALAANLAFMRIVSGDALSRVTTAGFSEKSRNLATSYIPKSFHLFLEKDPALFAISLAVFVIISAVSIAFWRNSAVLILAVLSSFAISSVLFLGTDGDASYRVVFPGQMILWAGLVLVFVTSILNSNLIARKSTWGIVLIPLLLFGLLATQGYEIAYNRISAANVSDLENLQCHLARSYNAISASETVVIRLKPIEVTGTNGVHSEIGLLGSHVDWVARDMWNLVTTTDSRHSDFKQFEVVIVSSDEVVDNSDDFVILNLAESC